MPRKLLKITSIFLCLLLLFEQSLPAGRQVALAQLAPSAVEGVTGQLDISGYLSNLHSSLTQEKFRPLHLRYLSYDIQANSFKLLLDKGDAFPNNPSNSITQATQELMKYFFVGISLPNDSFWVNLRPDSPDNIIDDFLAQTDVGKILLEADLNLKKDTAKATSPETSEGKKYWDRLYQKAEELLGQDNLTIPTLVRPWIVPGEIIIRETESNAYIYKATLKIMLEEDYLNPSNPITQVTQATQKDPRLKALNEYSSQLIRELIIPKLTKEVNTSKRYAPLRQVYYSLILAQWFKARFYGKGGLYSWLIDKRNLTGLTSKDNWSKTAYFKQYQQSFKDGEYNLKEPIQTPFGQSVRSYFSGGIKLELGLGSSSPLKPGERQAFGPTLLVGGKSATDVTSSPLLNSHLLGVEVKGSSNSAIPTAVEVIETPKAVSRLGGLTRRDFLEKTAAVVAAAGVLAEPLRGAGQPSRQMPLARPSAKPPIAVANDRFFSGLFQSFHGVQEFIKAHSELQQSIARHNISPDRIEAIARLYALFLALRNGGFSGLPIDNEHPIVEQEMFALLSDVGPQLPKNPFKYLFDFKQTFGQIIKLMRDHLQQKKAQNADIYKSWFTDPALPFTAMGMMFFLGAFIRHYQLFSAKMVMEGKTKQLLLAVNLDGRGGDLLIKIGQMDSEFDVQGVTGYGEPTKEAFGAYGDVDKALKEVPIIFRPIVLPVARQLFSIESFEMFAEAFGEYILTPEIAAFYKLSQEEKEGLFRLKTYDSLPRNYFYALKSLDSVNDNNIARTIAEVRRKISGPIQEMEGLLASKTYQKIKNTYLDGKTPEELDLLVDEVYEKRNPVKAAFYWRYGRGFANLHSTLVHLKRMRDDPNYLRAELLDEAETIKANLASSPLRQDRAAASPAEPVSNKTSSPIGHIIRKTSAIALLWTMLGGLASIQAKSNNLSFDPTPATIALAKDYQAALPEQTKIRYGQLAAIIRTPVENLMALELAETDGKNKAVSPKGAVGPLQVTPHNLNLVNSYVAEIKGLIAGRERLSPIDAHHYTAIQRIEKLIGQAPFSWDRVSQDPDYNRAVGAISFAMNFRLFYKWKLISMRRGGWGFVRRSPGEKPNYPILEATIAAHNLSWDIVWNTLREYGPINWKKHLPQETRIHNARFIRAKRALAAAAEKPGASSPLTQPAAASPANWQDTGTTTFSPGRIRMIFEPDHYKRALYQSELREGIKDAEIVILEFPEELNESLQKLSDGEMNVEEFSQHVQEAYQRHGAGTMIFADENRLPYDVLYGSKKRIIGAERLALNAINTRAYEQMLNRALAEGNFSRALNGFVELEYAQAQWMLRRDENTLDVISRTKGDNPDARIAVITGISHSYISHELSQRKMDIERIFVGKQGKQSMVVRYDDAIVRLFMYQIKKGRRPRVAPLFAARALLTNIWVNMLNRRGIRAQANFAAMNQAVSRLNFGEIKNIVVDLVSGKRTWEAIERGLIAHAGSPLWDDGAITSSPVVPAREPDNPDNPAADVAASPLELSPGQRLNLSQGWSQGREVLYKELRENFKQRHVVVGDVHGALEALKQVLRDAGLVDINDNWIGGDTVLVQMGDLIDRGPQSQETVAFLRKLQQQGAPIILLLGNHESLFIKGMLGDDLALINWFINGGAQMLIALNPDSNESQELKRKNMRGLARWAFDNKDTIRSNQTLKDLLQGFINDIESDRLLAAYAQAGILFVHGGVLPHISRGRPVDEVAADLNARLKWAVENNNFQNEIFAAGSSRRDKETVGIWTGIFWADFDTDLAAGEQSLDFEQVVAHTPEKKSGSKVRNSPQGKVTNVDVGLSDGYGGNRGYAVIEGSGLRAYELVRSTRTPKRILRGDGRTPLLFKAGGKELMICYGAEAKNRGIRPELNLYRDYYYIIDPTAKGDRGYMRIKEGDEIPGSSRDHGFWFPDIADDAWGLARIKFSKEGREFIIEEFEDNITSAASPAGATVEARRGTIDEVDKGAASSAAESNQSRRIRGPFIMSAGTPEPIDYAEYGPLGISLAPYTGGEVRLGVFRYDDLLRLFNDIRPESNAGYFIVDTRGVFEGLRDGEEVIIGRSYPHGFTLTDFVSRQHVRVQRQGDTIILTDLSSSNKTMLIPHLTNLQVTVTTLAEQETQAIEKANQQAERLGGIEAFRKTFMEVAKIVGAREMAPTPNDVRMYINLSTPPVIYADALRWRSIQRERLSMPEPSPYLAKEERIGLWKKSSGITGPGIYYCKARIERLAEQGYIIDAVALYHEILEAAFLEVGALDNFAQLPDNHINLRVVEITLDFAMRISRESFENNWKCMEAGMNNTLRNARNQGFDQQLLTAFGRRYRSILTQARNKADTLYGARHGIAEQSSGHQHSGAASPAGATVEARRGMIDEGRGTRDEVDKGVSSPVATGMTRRGWLRSSAIVSAGALAGALGAQQPTQSVDLSKLPLNDLLKLLASSDSDMRIAVISELGKRKAPEAILPLVQILDTDSNMDARVAAVRALQMMASFIFTSDYYGNVRDALIRTLSLSGENAAAVRLAAVELIGYFRSDEAVLPLTRVLLYDTNVDVRRAAAEVLGNICSQQRLFQARQLWRELNQQAVPALIQALLKDADAWVCMKAAYALFLIGDSRAIEPLVQALDRNESGLDVRGTIVMALGNFAQSNKQAVRQSQAAAKMIKILGNINEERSLRFATLLALGEMRDRQALPVLIQALSDKDSLLRQQAALTLGDIGDKEAIPALRLAMDNPKESEAFVSLEAAISLAKLADAFGLKMLLDYLLNDTADPYTCVRIALALRELGNSQALEPLFVIYSKIQDPHWPDWSQKILSSIVGVARNDRASKAIVAQKLNLSGQRLEIWDRFGVLVMENGARFSDAMFLQLSRVLESLPEQHVRAVNIITAEASYSGGLVMGRVGGKTDTEGKTITLYPNQEYADFIKEFSGDLIHEIAHLVYSSLSFEEQMTFDQLFWDSQYEIFVADGMPFYQDYVSDYAMSYYNEDFPETFRYYVMDGQALMLRAKNQAVNAILLKKIAFIAGCFAEKGEDGQMYTYVFKCNADGTITKVRLPLNSDGLPADTIFVSTVSSRLTWPSLFNKVPRYPGHVGGVPLKASIAPKEMLLPRPTISRRNFFSGAKTAASPLAQPQGQAKEDAASAVADSEKGKLPLHDNRYDFARRDTIDKMVAQIREYGAFIGKVNAILEKIDRLQALDDNDIAVLNELKERLRATNGLVNLHLRVSSGDMLVVFDLPNIKLLNTAIHEAETDKVIAKYQSLLEKYLQEAGLIKSAADNLISANPRRQARYVIPKDAITKLGVEGGVINQLQNIAGQVSEELTGYLHTAYPDNESLRGFQAITYFGASMVGDYANDDNNQIRILADIHASQAAKMARRQQEAGVPSYGTEFSQADFDKLMRLACNIIDDLEKEPGGLPSEDEMRQVRGKRTEELTVERLKLVKKYLDEVDLLDYLKTYPTDVAERNKQRDAIIEILKGLDAVTTGALEDPMQTKGIIEQAMDILNTSSKYSHITSGEAFNYHAANLAEQGGRVVAIDIIGFWSAIQKYVAGAYQRYLSVVEGSQSEKDNVLLQAVMESDDNVKAQIVQIMDAFVNLIGEALPQVEGRLLVHQEGGDEIKLFIPRTVNWEELAHKLYRSDLRIRILASELNHNARSLPSDLNLALTLTEVGHREFAEAYLSAQEADNLAKALEKQGIEGAVISQEATADGSREWFVYYNGRRIPYDAERMIPRASSSATKTLADEPDAVVAGSPVEPLSPSAPIEEGQFALAQSGALFEILGERGLRIDVWDVRRVDIDFHTVLDGAILRTYIRFKSNPFLNKKAGAGSSLSSSPAKAIFSSQHHINIDALRQLLNEALTEETRSLIKPVLTGSAIYLADEKGDVDVHMIGAIGIAFEAEGSQLTGNARQQFAQRLHQLCADILGEDRQLYSWSPDHEHELLENSFHEFMIKAPSGKEVKVSVTTTVSGDLASNIIEQYIPNILTKGSVDNWGHFLGYDTAIKRYLLVLYYLDREAFLPFKERYRQLASSDFKPQDLERGQIELYKDVKRTVEAKKAEYLAKVTPGTAEASGLKDVVRQSLYGSSAASSSLTQPQQAKDAASSPAREEEKPDVSSRVENDEQREIWRSTYQNERMHPVIRPEERVSSFARHIVRENLIPPGAKILTLGAWMGQDELYLAEQGYDVTATDFIEEPLTDLMQAARQKGTEVRIHIQLQDLRNPLQFGASSFDLIYAYLSLHYLNDEQFAMRIKEMKAILKPGGKIAIVVRSVYDRKFQEAPRREGDFIIDSKGKKQRFFSENSLRSFFESHFDSLSIIRQEVERYIDQGTSVFLELVAGDPIDFSSSASSLSTSSSSSVESNYKPGGVDASHSLSNGDKGGIDFRALPIVTQPALPTTFRDSPLRGQSLPNLNLDKEWLQIQKMLERGIAPSTDRLKAYLQFCCQNGDANKEIDKVLSCIADILRLEEERCCSTDAALRDMLVLLESDKPVNELQLALNKITVSPKEPAIKP